MPYRDTWHVAGSARRVAGSGGGRAGQGGSTEGGEVLGRLIGYNPTSFTGDEAWIRHLMQRHERLTAINAIDATLLWRCGYSPVRVPPHSI